MLFEEFELMPSLVSILSLTISVIALIYSDKTARRSAYLSIIPPARDKWQYEVREKAVSYFAEISLFLDEEGSALESAYKELIKKHFALVVLFFHQDKYVIDRMNSIRALALNLVQVDPDNKSSAKQAKEKITELQQELFDEILAMLEDEWRKQQYEVEGKWERKR